MDSQTIRERADRVRQHVNPLSQRYQGSILPVNWRAIFPHSELPLHIDIGCGAGRFVLRLANRDPQWNVVGLEIRRPLVDRANLWRQEQGLNNAYFIFTNATIHLGILFPPQSIHRLTIQFPDPWFKKRHQKRRVIQPQMVAVLARCLRPGALIFVQSDIAEVAVHIADLLAVHPGFTVPRPLDHNPIEIPTEREEHCLAQGISITRFICYRRDGGEQLPGEDPHSG